MKFRNLKRHLREGFKNVFRNGWMTVSSIAAVTVTLILVGAFLALMLNLDQRAEKIEEDVEMSVHIDRTADDAQIKVLGKQIEQIAQVDTVVFSSKEDELKNLIKSMCEEGEYWELFEQDKQLIHSFSVLEKKPIIMYS